MKRIASGQSQSKTPASMRPLEAHWAHEVISNFFREHKESDEPFALGVELVRSKNKALRPLLGYLSDIRLLPSGAYLVKTSLKLAPLKAPQWEPYGLFNFEHNFVQLEYELFTDSRGVLTSSKWISENRILALVDSNDAPTVDREFELLSSLYQPNVMVSP